MSSSPVSEKKLKGNLDSVVDFLKENKDTILKYGGMGLLSISGIYFVYSMFSPDVEKQKVKEISDKLEETNTYTYVNELLGIQFNYSKKLKVIETPQIKPTIVQLQLVNIGIEPMFQSQHDPKILIMIENMPANTSLEQYLEKSVINVKKVSDGKFNCTSKRKHTTDRLDWFELRLSLIVDLQEFAFWAVVFKVGNVGYFIQCMRKDFEEAAQELFKSFHVRFPPFRNNLLYHGKGFQIALPSEVFQYRKDTNYLFYCESTYEQRLSFMKIIKSKPEIPVTTNKDPSSTRLDEKIFLPGVNKEARLLKVTENGRLYLEIQFLIENAKYLVICSSPILEMKENFLCALKSFTLTSATIENIVSPSEKAKNEDGYYGYRNDKYNLQLCLPYSPDTKSFFIKDNFIGGEFIVLFLINELEINMYQRRTESMDVELLQDAIKEDIATVKEYGTVKNIQIRVNPMGNVQKAIIAEYEFESNTYDDRKLYNYSVYYPLMGKGMVVVFKCEFTISNNEKSEIDGNLSILRNIASTVTFLGKLK